MYDVIIIGAGPAGITAAIYCARAKLSALVLSKNIGGQAALSADIQNYTGYQFVTGAELAEKFHSHLDDFPAVEHHEAPEAAAKLKRTEKGFALETDAGAYEARAVIICSGANPRRLGVPGEKELLNKGLSYCATCDAPLFKNKDVAVVGGGNSAMDAVLQLLKYAENVFVLTVNPELAGDAVMKEKILAEPRAKVIANARTTAVVGSKFVEAIKYSRAGGPEQALSVQGVFVEIGWMPATEFVDFVEKNQLGEIKVNPACETSVPGVFAAGDCTDVPEKQIIVAAGMGAVAALSAIKYLSRRK
ncbi:MAG: FAD-dependent oxidoreductase [Candidatus Micrarchaeota archaeon]